MKITRQSDRRSGFVMMELLVAMAIIVIALLPLGFAFAHDQVELRDAYRQTVAMELIDGEMEILMAGEWRAFKPGAQPYPLKANSTKNLPHGSAMLTITGKRVRLEWIPANQRPGNKIIREALVE